MTKTPHFRKKPKLTDAERHKRFVEVGRLVGASEKSEDFDKSFERLDIKTSSGRGPERAS